MSEEGDDFEMSFQPCLADAGKRLPYAGDILR